MDLERREDGTIWHRFTAGEPAFPVALSADNVRREHTGVHARVTLRFGSTTAAFDTFNVGRDGDRIRLANSAYQHIAKGDEERLSKQRLKHELDLFCRALWPFLLADDEAHPIAGDAEPSEPLFVLDPFILEAGGTFLFGPPERAKSWVAMLMAVSIDAGLSDLFKVPQQRRALYVNLERSEASMTRRLGQVNLALGLPRERELLWRQGRGRALDDVLDGMRRDVRTHGIEVIIFDSVSRSGVGDLRDDRTANRIVDGLNSTGAAWVGLAHSPRGDDTHIFGSMHFEAGADVMVRVLRERKGDLQLGVGLEVTKANDLPPQPVYVMALEFNRRFALQVARPSSTKEFPQINEGAQRSNADKLLDVLAYWTSGSIKELAEEADVSLPTARRIIPIDDRFIEVKKEGRTRYWARADKRQDSL